MSYTGNDRFLHHLEMSEQALDRAREQLEEMSDSQTDSQTDSQPTYDDRATEVITRWLDRNEIATDICEQIITRAYEDAAQMRRLNPDWIEFYQPRTDAADGVKEYFDSLNPLTREREFILDEASQTVTTASVFDGLILYALDRVNWPAIVDRLRERMAS